MATKLHITYLVDSIEGNALVTTISGPDNGWVEYCNQRGQLVYADAVSQEFFKKCHQQAIDTIVKHVLVSNKKQLGFINHLSMVLLNDDFVMPMFGVLQPGSDRLEITTGLTRMIASIINGRTANDLKTIAYMPTGQTTTQLQNAKPLTSTDTFEQIYNLTDIDYEISMSDCERGDMTEFKFDRSVLKHSIYDKKDQALPHTQLGSDIVGYWNKHIKNDKIKLNIKCTPDVEKLIQPSKIFDYTVVHEKHDEWHWSYGKILAAYRKTDEPLRYDQSKIHLWLYDVTEPVNLEFLLPWITGQYTCCHTKNKKALFFDTTSDVTSMQIIGNWCQ